MLGKVLRDSKAPSGNSHMSGNSKTMPSLSALALRSFLGAATLTSFAVNADQVDAQAANAEIEEVIVTSSGSIQARLGTSGSISVLGGDEIAKVAATHPSDLLNRVAGVWVNKGSGQEHLTAIRSAIYTGSGACGEFAFLEDGIPLRPHGFCNINNLFELNTEQASAIEVWRGPASAVLGGNALHGAVNVITPVPSENAIGVEVGPYDFHRVNLQAGTQIGKHQLGIALVSASNGGYRADSGYGQQKLHLSHLTDWAGWAVKNQATVTLLNQETGGYVGGFESYDDPVLRKSNPNPEAFRDAWSGRINSELQKDAWTLKPYLRRSKMQFLQHFLPGQPLEDNNQTSGGLIVDYDLSRSNTQLHLGGQIEFMSGGLREFQASPTTGSAFLVATRPAGLHYDYDVDSQLLAGFYDLVHSFSDDLRLINSLRLEYLNYDYTNNHITGNTRDDGTACSRGGCLYTRPASREDDFSNIGARLGFERDLNDTSLVYATASTGFRPPQVTELYRLRGGQTIADLNSERLNALEVGYKNNNLSVAAFAEKTRNFILRDSEAFNVSDGRTRSVGVEFSGNINVGAHRFDLVTSYAEHKYDFDRAADGREQISDGNFLDSAPRWLGQVRWSSKLGERVEQELELSGVGSHYVNAANTAKYDGHFALNWRVQWQATEKAEISLRVMNVLDERYADRADFAFGNYRYFPALPRQFYLGARYILD